MVLEGTISIRRLELGRDVYLDKSTTVRITDEMKTVFPSLKRYTELIVNGKLMTWWDADRYAYEHAAELPGSEELKDIYHLVDMKYHKFRCGWTREVREEHSRFAGTVYMDDGQCWCSWAEKYYENTVFCVRR